MTQSIHQPLRLGHATLLPKPAALSIIVLTAIALAAPSQSQQLPNLAGTIAVSRSQVHVKTARPSL